jgi:hypothetical protein
MADRRLSAHFGSWSGSSEVSELTNERALADVALVRSEFHAVFDGALRADGA